MKRKTNEQFIIDAYCKHGDKYNYKLVNYKNNKTKVKIICPIHGVFEQKPGYHLNGSECHICMGYKQKLTTQEFIIDAYCKHGDRYNYKLVDSINAKTKVKIICPIHGVFEQTPNNHLQNNGCFKCFGSIKKTNEQFIIDAYCKHGDKYNYKLVDYKNNKTKVKIICPIHGVFEQKPVSHLLYGCNKCKYITIKDKLSKTDEQFIIDAYYIHGDRYNYKLVDSINTKTKVKIICPIHGVFEQTPDGHTNQQQGCPKCSHIISKQETELQDWLKQYISIDTNNRELIKPYELDIVIPKHKLCIEYNGLYWHSEQQGKDKRYHLNKYNLCKDQGYRLIQIWENEWLFKQDIVKSIILNAIGINNRVIHGRKCIIKDVLPKEARIMYDNNHIQGFKGGLHHGLYYKGELVSLMTIDKRNELQRFVNLKYTKVHGSFSKLLKSYNLTDCYTFADLRYFTGNVYESNDFKYNKIIPPRYSYFKNMIVYHRRLFQKQYLNNKLDHFDINETEYRNMLNNGYDRIWDTGKIKYIKNIQL